MDKEYQKRILAIEVDNELFNAIDQRVEEAGLTKKAYVKSLIFADLEQTQKFRQTEEQESGETFEEEAQETTPQNKPENQVKVWEAEEVRLAIDQFINETGRVPTQREFKTENGLPSYKAARRCLEASPALYAQQRYEELIHNQEYEETDVELDDGLTMSM